MKQQNAEWLVLIILFGCALFLFLGNLGNQYLWDDEAETALISKTILAHGVPMGYDGKNYFSQLMGADCTKNYLWIWHPWLPFYLLALFFQLFGVNTFVARLPFAILGIASVFMTYYFCKTLLQSRRTAAIAASLLLISVPFLILSRQCRYYSMASFFSLAVLYAYIGILNNKKYSSVFFVLSSVLLFHTLYSYCAATLAAVGLHALLFHRSNLRKVLSAVAVIVLLNVFWIVWFLGKKQSGQQDMLFTGLWQLPRFALIYLQQIAKYIFPPYLLLIIPLAAIVNYMRTGVFSRPIQLFRRELSLLLLFIFFTVVALTLASPKPFFRYLAPLIPIFAILVALLVRASAKIHSCIAAAIVIVLIFTGHLKSFLYEITHDYDGPIEGIVKFLNENGDKDDVVAITYGDLPLKFYTNMRVIGALTGEDLSDAIHADWIILRKYAISSRDEMVREYLFKNTRLENYEILKIDYPDIPSENREDPNGHYFRTVTDEDKVIIFHKIR